MNLDEFIKNNRDELQHCIQYKRNWVPRTASCDCHLNRTDHLHIDPKGKIDDEEIRQWILNDEGLYLWAKREGVEIWPHMTILSFTVVPLALSLYQGSILMSALSIRR